MKLFKKAALVTAATTLALSAFAGAAYADVAAPNGKVLKTETSYRVSSTISCPVTIPIPTNPISIDFGKGLVEDTIIKPMSDGKIMCGLTLGTVKGSILGQTFEGFVSKTGTDTAFNGYKDENGKWVESKVFESEETYAGQDANGSANLNKVDTMLTYLYTDSTGKLKSSYDLGLYINNAVRPTQLGYNSGYSATLNIDWDASLIEIIGSLTTSSLTLDKTSYAYTGSAITPAVSVSLDGKTLVEGTDYTVAYKNNTEVGTASVTVTGAGAYAGSTTKTFTIKNVNPMTVKAATAKVKKSKKAQTVKAITVSKAQGKVTYVKKKGAACLKVNKSTGKITVKKSTKKGTYKATITVKAAGNALYNSATKNIKVTVKVK